MGQGSCYPVCSHGNPERLLGGRCLFSVMVYPPAGEPGCLFVCLGVGAGGRVMPNDGGCPGVAFPHLLRFHIALNYGSGVTLLSPNALGISLRGPPGELIELLAGVNILSKYFCVSLDLLLTLHL